MSLRRSWTNRLARLAGRTPDDEAQPEDAAAEPQDALAESAARTASHLALLAEPLLASWAELMEAVQREGRDFATPHQLALAAEVQSRLAPLEGQTPDPDTL